MPYRFTKSLVVMLWCHDAGRMRLYDLVVSNQTFHSQRGIREYGHERNLSFARSLFSLLDLSFLALELDLKSNLKTFVF